MSNETREHLNKLGLPCEDKVTGISGVVVSISFDLYGCIQALLHPGVNEQGELRESMWFDINRLKVIHAKPVMERPDFVVGPVARGEKGPAEKPSMGMKP